MYGMIGTWSMATLGVEKASPLLAQGQSSGDVVEEAISAIEDYPYFKSVGYGGLPNAIGELEMDSAFMNGDDFQIGAIAGVKDIANPIRVSRRLSQERVNNFLVAQGAQEYAKEQGFEPKT
ncbi:MAG TPA: isoaspartyl peptidase/L-asparaginase, partial [Candidatus Ligilactobacillus excrementipullorum]|nr:isoaspartyl peptidase/L-asparaginase [Candidatus Ligilactobacillus excrementipullorum]